MSGGTVDMRLYVQRRAQPLQFVHWDLVGFTLFTFFLVVLAIWLALYFPAIVVAIGWQWFLLLFWVLGILVIVGGKALFAVMGRHTSEVMTPAGTFLIADTSGIQLPPLSGFVSMQRLRQAGIDVPDYLVDKATGKLKITPGSDEMGRPIRAWRYLLGGYRMWDVWAGFRGSEGVLIVLGTPLADVGDRNRGGCYFTPRLPSRVNHGDLPEDWIKVLQEDTKSWRPNQTPVWVAGAISPGFIDELVLPMAEELKTYLDDAPKGAMGLPTAQAMQTLAFAKIGEANSWKVTADEYRDSAMVSATAHARAAQRTAEGYGGRRPPPASYVGADRAPAPET